MSPERLEQKLSGQTVVARKVFAAVPSGDAWPITQIFGEVKRQTGSPVDPHTGRGCLVALLQSGLIMEPEAGKFKRVVVHERVKAQAIPAAPKEEVKPAEQPARRPVSDPKERERDPISLLSGIASSMKSVADQMTALANDVEEAALVIQADIDENAENVAKLKQLQGILKSLA